MQATIDDLREDVETTVDEPQLKATFEAAAAVRPATAFSHDEQKNEPAWP
ncbi:hypothetical protein [Mesorhizobium muleiense]|nr:hypothetical protein [Mesorhizobium muleiense]MCF6114435.1 hypothetical protein [Mesorhizobium muleiense]